MPRSNGDEIYPISTAREAAPGRRLVGVFVTGGDGEPARGLAGLMARAADAGWELWAYDPMADMAPGATDRERTRLALGVFCDVTMAVAGDGRLAPQEPPFDYVLWRGGECLPWHSAVHMADRAMGVPVVDEGGLAADLPRPGRG